MPGEPRVVTADRETRSKHTFAIVSPGTVLSITFKYCLVYETLCFRVIGGAKLYKLHLFGC